MKDKINFLIALFVALSMGFIGIVLSPLMAVLIIAYEQGLIIRNWIKKTLEEYL